MTTPALWDTALWDGASWDTLLVEGAITNGDDITNGGIAVIDNVGGLITENPDIVVGDATVIYTITGDITENPDDVVGVVGNIIPISGAITENEDIADGGIGDRTLNTLYGLIVENEDIVVGTVGNIVNVYGNVKNFNDVVRGNIQGPQGAKRPGGGWAPQIYIKREWEIEAEVEPVEDDFVYEPDPEAMFIPTALPIDPAVARMIGIMMRKPDPINADDDDVESILMHL